MHLGSTLAMVVSSMISEGAPPHAATPDAWDDAPRVAEFPDMRLSAGVGQWVFAPTRASLDETKADATYHSPSYAQAQVVEVGQTASKLSFDGGAAEVIPNAYILPLPSHEEVAPGDVILGSRFGNALELAVVTTGSAGGASPEADFVESRPYGGEHLFGLEAGRYLKLDGTLRPGAIAAVKHAEHRPSFGVVVAVAGDKVLLAGFMGAAVVADKGDVVALEGRPGIAVGDQVMARFASGDFVKAKVTAVGPGAHFATVDFAELNAPKPEVIPLLHVTKRL